ncbi:mask, partial [Symbiodinium pilosum]
EEFVNVQALKKALQAVCGELRFRQRLISGGQELEDFAGLADVKDLHLVLVPFTASSQEEASKSIIQAIVAGLLEPVETFLREPRNPDIADNIGRTPLGQACESGHLDIVRLLLE